MYKWAILSRWSIFFSNSSYRSILIDLPVSKTRYQFDVPKQCLWQQRKEALRYHKTLLWLAYDIFIIFNSAIFISFSSYCRITFDIKSKIYYKWNFDLLLHLWNITLSEIVRILMFLWEWKYLTVILYRAVFIKKVGREEKFLCVPLNTLSNYL